MNGNFAYWLGGVCVLLTSYYSFRLCFLTFFTESKALKPQIEKSHDAPFIMAIPLMILAIGSIFVGYCGKDMMIGIGTTFWGNALFTLPESSNILESEFIPQSVKLLPFFFTMLGVVLAFLFNANENKFVSHWATKKAYTFKISKIGRQFYSMLNKRWFFDKVYNDIFAQKALDFGYQISFKRLDKGTFEILGAQGICSVFSKATRELSLLQSGMIYHYAFVMVIGLTLFITSVTLWDFLSDILDSRLSFLFLLAFLVSIDKNKSSLQQKI